MINIDTLRKIEIFSELSDKSLNKIKDIIKIEKLDKGSVIFSENDIGDSLYILIKGKVSITKNLILKVSKTTTQNVDKIFTVLTADNKPMFGEIALLIEDSKRTATIKTLEQSEILVLEKNELLELLKSDYELGFYIFFNISKKLASNLKKANSDILKLTTALSIALES